MSIDVALGANYTAASGLSDAGWMFTTTKAPQDTPAATCGSILIRKSAVMEDGVETSLSSNVVTISIPFRPAAPTQVRASAETVKERADGGFVFTGGLRVQQRWRSHQGRLHGRRKAGLGSYQVREKATGSSFESETVTLTVTAMRFAHLPDGGNDRAWYYAQIIGAERYG